MTQPQIVQPTSCSCCRQAHSACNKQRPCARCIKLGKECMDVVKGQTFKRQRSESLPATKKNIRLTAKLSLPGPAAVRYFPQEDPLTYDPDSLLRDSVDPKIIECHHGQPPTKSSQGVPKPSPSIISSVASSAIGTALTDYTFAQSQRPGSVVPVGTAGVLGCHNCRISHVSCDKGRPCNRCVRLTATHLCVDPAPSKKSAKSRSLPPCQELNDEPLPKTVEEPFCFRMTHSELMEEAQQLGLKVEKDQLFINTSKHMSRVEETEAYPTPSGTPPPVADLDFLVSEDEFPIYLTVQS